MHDMFCIPNVPVQSHGGDAIHLKDQVCLDVMESSNESPSLVSEQYTSAKPCSPLRLMPKVLAEGGAKAEHDPAARARVTEARNFILLGGIQGIGTVGAITRNNVAMSESPHALARGEKAPRSRPSGPWQVD